MHPVGRSAGKEKGKRDENRLLELLFGLFLWSFNLHGAKAKQRGKKGKIVRRAEETGRDKMNKKDREHDIQCEIRVLRSKTRKQEDETKQCLPRKTSGSGTMHLSSYEVRWLK